jgi:hypothetical protein
MTEVPPWVVYSAGVFFVVAVLLNVALLIAVYVLVTKVMPLIADLRGQIKTIGDRVSNITAGAQDVVQTVQTRTHQVLGSAEEASAEVARKVSAASAAITAIFVVTRLVGALRGMSGGGSHHKRAKA